MKLYCFNLDLGLKGAIARALLAWGKRKLRRGEEARRTPPPRDPIT